MNRLVAGVVGIVLLTTAAGVDAAAPPGDGAIEDYLGAFTESDPAAAQALTEPDSPAFWYAAFKSAQAAASEQAGQPLSPVTVKASDGAAEMCTDDSTLPCATFAGFQANDDGQIVTFTINTNDIAPRLGVGAEPVAVGADASARVLVSYRTVTNEALVVAVEVTVPGTGDLTPVATYQTPDGERLEAIDLLGLTTVDGAAAVILLVFPATDPGGQVNWSPTIDGAPAPLVLSVPVLLGPGGSAPKKQ